MVRALVAASITLLCVVHSGSAQAGRTASKVVGEIRGQLIDSTTGKPVVSGSVAVRHAGDSVFVSGALPKDDGTFRVDGLAPGRYSLRVRAIGYDPRVVTELVITPQIPTADAGIIRLVVVAAKLPAATTTAEREDVMLSPDRTTYNVKSMHAASGGTVIDVLRNIPLIEVDGSNNVSLRGSTNVVIQINGRSTPLKGDQLAAFLAQLPAATIKNVEVATNPSAKDDPEGTAGIINIVLGQDARLGLSGGVVAGTSSSGMVNISGNAGKQQGKLVLFGSTFVYRDRRSTTSDISRTYLALPVPASTEGRLAGHNLPISLGSTVRAEYRFTEQTALSFDGFGYRNRFARDNVSDYVNLDRGGDVLDSFRQLTTQASKSKYVDLDVAVRRFTSQHQPKFSSEIEFSNSLVDTHIDTSSPELTTASAGASERDQTTWRTPYLTWKTDYTAQFGASAKAEVGVKTISRSTASDFSPREFNLVAGDFIVDSTRRSSTNYREDIVSGYLLISNRIGNFQSQSGIRLEDAATYLDLRLAADRRDRRYGSVYPSAILSYSFSPLRQARVSYSKRVSRPSPYQLSPAEFRQDSRNISRGNPNLRAEYTDMVEGAYQETRPWGTLQITPYLRRTAHAIRNIQLVDSTGVSLNVFDNVAAATTFGSDVTVNAHAGPLQLTGGTSMYHYRSDASNLSPSLSAHATVWSGRTNATWRLGLNSDVQANLYYRAPYANEGGSQIAAVSMTFGARYKVWGDQGNVAVRISDPFNLQKSGYRMVNTSVIESAESLQGWRAIYVTITRNFGKALKLQTKQQDPDSQPPMQPPA